MYLFKNPNLTNFFFQYRRFSDMVFDNGEYQENRNTNAAQRLQALRAASCVKILGKGVIKVVHRVDDAKENNNLGKVNNFLFKCIV